MILCLIKIINMIVIKFKMIHLNHQFLLILKDLHLDKTILNNSIIPKIWENLYKDLEENIKIKKNKTSIKIINFY